MRLRLTTLGCCGALGLVLASRVGLLRKLLIKAQVLATLRVRLLRLGSESLETWVRTQLQLHAVLDLEVNRRLAGTRSRTKAGRTTQLSRQNKTGSR